MTTTHPVQRGRRYRHLMLGVIVAGIAAFFVGVEVGEYFAGLVIYAVAVTAGFAILGYVRFHDSMALQDEREAELERRASHVTFQLFGYVGLFAFIGIFLLSAAGHYAVSETVKILLYAFSTVSLSWGVIYVALRLRSRL